MEDGPRTFDFFNPTDAHANCASFGPPRFPYLRVILALTLGVGKSFWSALTYDEILWWVWHKQYIDEWMGTSWQPCPILTKNDVRWDLVQILTFVGTAGCYVAERRGAVTSDGYMLISHKLHQVPEHIQNQFYNPRVFTLSTLLMTALIHLILGRSVNSSAPNKTSTPATHTSLWAKKPTVWMENSRVGGGGGGVTVGGDFSQNDHCQNELLVKGGGGGDHNPLPNSRVITQGECLLPVESTRATGSTANIIFDNTPCPAARSEAAITSPSPDEGGGYSGHEEPAMISFDEVAAPPLGGGVLGPQSYGEDYNTLLLNPPTPLPKAHKVVVFQHGLLETSASYIFPLWGPGPNEKTVHVPLRLARCLMMPLTLLGRVTRYLLRQWICLWPSRRNRECQTRLRHSLPINALVEEPTLEVWLTNTRGSEFSCNLRDPNIRCIPTGTRRLMYSEYRQIFNVYTNEYWTYVDSAILDCEALYNMLFQYYRTSRIDLTAVAFSQGCAVFALNSSIKAKLLLTNPTDEDEGHGRGGGGCGGGGGGVHSGDREDDEVLMSPPNFPLQLEGQEVITTRTGKTTIISNLMDEISGGDIAYSSPRPGSAFAVTTPAWECESGGGVRQDRLDVAATPKSFEQCSKRSDELFATGLMNHSGWTSGIFSNLNDHQYGFDVTFNDHLRGLCSGLRGGCEYCSITPKHLILIAPPIMLKPLTAPAKSLSECWKVVFCKTAWTHLHYLVAIVTIIQSFLHVRFGLIGQIFVQYVLCFGIRPMHRDVADLIYKLVPSGMTTRENMLLWNSQMDGSSVLGSDMKYMLITTEFARLVWKVDRLPRDVELNINLPCMTTIYSGIQDNIADSIASASRFVREGAAALRLLDINDSDGQLLKISAKSKINVNLITGSSHLDILWPASNNQLVRYIMHDVLSNDDE